MKLKFKIQAFQSNAVGSVVDCFVGQPNTPGIQYRVDPGTHLTTAQFTGFKNEDMQLSDAQLLGNIRGVQRKQALSQSDKLVSSAECRLNLDVEMETGTGKTYCYIKTIFEMNRRYGWTKFIIVVPSIAIREGVLKSLKITQKHFKENYSKTAHPFVYNSKRLQQIENFSAGASINVMIINIQAFNASGKDNRRIYEELDDFQSRRPIDVISKNRPILILDEPQKMEGKKTLTALAKFNPLMILRYSATHRTVHNKIHRLDALDAYKEKLVKKISVRGITVKGLAGTHGYLYFESIEISKKAPVARIEMEVRQSNGIKRIVKKLGKDRDLFSESNGLAQYRGFVIAQIDANKDTVEFTNGHVLSVGDAMGNITEMIIRRIQIRETIKTHLEKEMSLFAKGIKVLSLFFIDEVAKYRDYSQANEQGEYARIFEEEHEKLKAEYLSELPIDNKAYRKYLSEIPARRTHGGYFSIDKKSKKLTNSKVKTTGENAGHSDDEDAYDLILRDKERLLSFSEPVRFIFSHSALREGWDNPNVFVMCMLKHSDNTISRRQEVGRGLRICVNQDGDRMDNPATVHDINVLTVVASESYKDFVSNLQHEICDSLSSRLPKADETYFTGKTITTEDGEVDISTTMAKQIGNYLKKSKYTDASGQITGIYNEAKDNDVLAKLPAKLAPHADQIFGLIDQFVNESKLPVFENDRKPKTNRLNENFKKREFKALWSRINQKMIYQVDFDSNELVKKCTQAIDADLKVATLQYSIQSGEQIVGATYEQLRIGDGFTLTQTSTEAHKGSIHSTVKIDLLGNIADNTCLTRKTITEILSKIHSAQFEKFKLNPEHFIAESSRIIKEQKATMIVEKLSYDSIAETFDVEIFTANQIKQDFTRATEKLKNHIYDYAITDSKIEKNFVKNLDISSEVVVYAKLPRGFLIPTPVGDYNPDWAISFKEGSVKHVYFVAETKGSVSSMNLRSSEEIKIQCARKFFEEISRKIDPEHVKYDVVTDYGMLMEIVGVGEAQSQD
ncbi:MAG: DEAD/DEAH box helicase family protein [Gammaproteobacteria bacterium]|nr:DEAD/DEAH box helicase family protein [Gammaproteobacteria bacterium]